MKAFSMLCLLPCLCAGEARSAEEVNIARREGVTYRVYPGSWQRRLFAYPEWAKVIDPDLLRFKPTRLDGQSLVDETGKTKATVTLAASQIISVKTKSWEGKPGAQSPQDILDDKGKLKGRVLLDPQTRAVRQVLLADPQGAIGERQGLLTDGNTTQSAVRYPYMNGEDSVTPQDMVLTVEFDLGRPTAVQRIVLHALRNINNWTFLNKVMFSGSTDGVRYFVLGEVSGQEILPLPPTTGQVVSQATFQAGGKPLRFVRISGWTDRFIDFTEVEIWSKN